jgi:hypothetical protein
MNIKFNRIAPLLAISLVATLLGATLPSFASEAELTVTDATVRAVPPGTPTSGAFMIISNGSNVDRKLLKADSPVAKTVELHNHINDNGVMRMRQVKEIEVKANDQVALKSGSYHIMLIGLKQTLNEGDSVPITLTFDDGSTKKIDAPVKMPQATMKMGSEMDHDKMKH